MTTTTSPDNLPKPDTTDQIANVQANIGSLADGTQTALTLIRTTRAISSWRVANTTVMNALTGMLTNDRAYNIADGGEYRYNGATWDLWNLPTTAYTPTYTNLTIGNGTSAYNYSIVEGVAHFKGLTTLGTTSSVTGVIIVSTPFIVGSATTAMLNSQIVFVDASAGSVRYGGVAIRNGNTSIALLAQNVAGTYSVLTSTSSTIPFGAAFATTDTIQVAFSVIL